MRRLKRLLIVITAAALVFGCLGCSNIISYFEHQFSLPENSVRFYIGEDQDETLLTVAEVMAYESPYAYCNSTWFRDQLEGEDLCIYNAYLYAMEHGCNGFELYVADNEKDFSFIREAVSLDSPFLEQNFNTDGESSVLWSANRIGERVRFQIDHFNEAAWQNKLLALEQCQRIVAGIPEDCVSQEQKMAYLYRYVCDSVEYTEYTSYSGQAYLYDAVMKGQTNCDGYANMLSLLFHLIGVETCEAMGDNLGDAQTQQQSDEMGHTWVVAKLDGMFYNFDPTYEDTASEAGETAGLYFAFSDELVDMKYVDCDEMRPKCTDTSRDLDYAQLVIDDAGSANIKQVAKLTDSRVAEGETETLIVLKALLTEQEFEDFLDSYINKTQRISKVSASMVVLDSFTSIKLTVTPW